MALFDIYSPITQKPDYFTAREVEAQQKLRSGPVSWFYKPTGEQTAFSQIAGQFAPVAAIGGIATGAVARRALKGTRFTDVAENIKAGQIQQGINLGEQAIMAATAIAGDP